MNPINRYRNSKQGRHFIFIYITRCVCAFGFNLHEILHYMAQSSTIQLQVGLDENKVPETIHWQAAEGGVHKPTEAKAFMLSIWDLNESAALRIDLWTKKMMVDEMNDFFFQTFMTMADTYQRATNQAELADEIRTFSKAFKTKMEENMKKNQL